MSQNDNAIPTFDKMFKLLEQEGTQIARIIELGTFHGGLSVLLGTYCYMKDIPFTTYDKEPFVNELPKIKNLFNSLKINYKLIDINKARNEICAEIKKPGTTLLLCDGGDKPHEFRYFSKHLKSGDIIMAHDYAYDQNKFESDIQNKLWNWFEISHKDISEACEENNLQDFMQKDFDQAVWACKRKV